MITREDVQSWIDRLDGGAVEAEELEPGLWRVHTQEGAEVVVNYAPPVVILRVRVMEVPGDDRRRADLFRQLLTFNAHELVHGSYGLENGHVVLTDTLELDGLDYRALESSFDALTVSLASHLGALAAFREG